MPPDRIEVHLLPGLVEPEQLRDGPVVVIDVLRATTTMLDALAAGCSAVMPCGEIADAQRLAASFPPGTVIMGGERGGLPIPGFDRGNSPGEYTPEVCRGKVLIMTTTNGTRALLRVCDAATVWIGAFANLGAVCRLAAGAAGTLHLVCAGTQGTITLDDTLCAGAIAERLDPAARIACNDPVNLARAAFLHYGADLLAALRISRGGRNLQRIGLDRDIMVAARVDRLDLVPELRRDPLRVVRPEAPTGPVEP